MPAKVILFAGAPPRSLVTESSCTLSAYIPPFTVFLDIRLSTQPAIASQTLAAWRSLPLTRQPLTTGLTQSHSFAEDIPRHSTFFTTADVSLDDLGGSLDDETAQEALTQFCEASLSALENTSLLSEFDSFDTSFMTTSSAGDPSTNSQQPQSIAAHLSDLEDIPPAPRIVALNPSTVTLNLIVGVLSIAQPRSVTTRWGKTMSLIEVLVGDDTRSGFAVTFWVPGPDVNESPVSRLRRQDVVLMQNVALHVFRGKVYGQSLRKNMTKLNVLWGSESRGLYSTRTLSKAGSSHPQIEKTRLVKDWVLKFVGAAPGTKVTARKGVKRTWDEPPLDSQ